MHILFLVFCFLACIFAFRLFLSETKGKENLAVGLLVIAAACIRLYFSFEDNFLQEWDERFHALVAKHLTENPLLPLLYKNTVFEHDLNNWSMNTVWLHKQPLFLWQMAASIQLFGETVIAARIPSIVLNSLSVALIYSIARQWFISKQIAIIAALLVVFNAFEITQVIGEKGMDHNDISFTFYVTLGVWALLKYMNTKQIQWVVLLGAAIGFAVLNKWLTAYVLLGAFQLVILVGEKQWIKNSWKTLLVLIVSLVIWLPWQFYIFQEFPEQAAYELQYNSKHFSQVVEGHRGPWYIHLFNQTKIYSWYFVAFLPIGVGAIFFRAKKNWRKHIVLLSIPVVLILFFSIAKTKLDGYTLPASAVLFPLIGFAIVTLYEILMSKIRSKKIGKIIFISIGAAFCMLSISKLFIDRLETNSPRNSLLSKKEFLKALAKEDLSDKVVINLNLHENIEFMFYSNVYAAYGYIPTEEELKEAIDKGYKILCLDGWGFPNLPPFISAYGESIQIVKQEEY